MSLRILISSSDEKQRAHLVSLCESLGGRAFEASDAREALAGAKTSNPQVILLGAEACAGEVLTALEAACPGAAIWRCGAIKKGTAQSQLDAGATDLLDEHPSREQLEHAFAREKQRRRLTQERDQILSELDQLRGTDLIGRSRPMLRLHDQIQRIASTPRTTVLVTGEVGTGKESVARAIHRSSARAPHPFVPVSCGLPSETLAETLFYGDLSEAQGQPTHCALVRAEGGTLFLDQIDCASLELQERLLELVQDRCWRSLANGEDRHADVRVVASTSKDLARLVAEGRFREDLLYRLNVLTLDVPALRERGEDIALLANHFLIRIAREMGRSAPTLAPESTQAMQAHGWPSNVRELHNVLERGLIVTAGRVITCSDLGLGEGSGEGSPLHEGEDFRIRHMEEVLIRRALVSTGGNRSQTARLLGVNRTTLYNKLRVYEIEE
jgi:DNA-binding NtrC family response regulator